MRRTAKFEPARRRASGGSRLRFAPLLADVPVRFWVFAFFLATVFLMGGGSRDDVLSLAILRPACAFFAAYAFSIAAPGEIARLRVPLLLLLALAVWMVIQLIPLPPALWSALPHRAAIAEVDRLVGLEGLWRPISLSPSKTMNSLASLVVPATALLLYAVQADAERRRIVGLLFVAAVISALWGAAQMVSGGTGMLYLYTITNEHSAVGLFANRNHNAVFLATMFVVAGFMFAEQHRLKDRSIKPWLVAGACLLVLIMLYMCGSRGGLLIGVLAMGLALALYFASRRGEDDDDRRHRGVMRYLPIAAIVVIATGAAFYFFGRSSSFDRLTTLSIADEIRVQVFPQVAAMAQENWLFGTGFGAFEHAYRQYESSAWLQETYLNNAHDDWLQWVIEGGLPAILIALTFVAWLGRRALAHWRARAASPARTQMVAMALGVLLLLIVASALDYPLRVPSMMLYAVLMVALVADPPEPQAKANRRSRSAAKPESGGA